MPAFLGLRNEYREFHVVFAPSRFNRIWSMFCRMPFRHCWVFWASYYDSPGLMAPRITLKMEAQSSNIDFDVWHADPNEVAAAFLPFSTDILRITLPFKTSLRYSPRGIITCVSIVKSAMDIKAWQVLTPEELYRYLLKIGAQSLKEEYEKNSAHERQICAG